MSTARQSMRLRGKRTRPAASFPFSPGDLAVAVRDRGSTSSALALVTVAALPAAEDQAYTVDGNGEQGITCQPCDLLTLDEAAGFARECVTSGRQVSAWPPPQAAAASGLVASLEGELNCSICLGLLCRPHVVPCGHTFCGSWCAPAPPCSSRRRRLRLSSL